MNKTVFINRIAKFLPGSPVSNNEMEEYLGIIGGDIRSRSKAIVLRNNKITTRYYSVDKKGNSTHSNAELTAEAVKALAGNNFQLSDMELLTCGTTSPDQLLPGHASMVHGKLNTKPIEAISFAGSCCAGMTALKYGHMSVMTGSTQNAVATGSEKFSLWMQANSFKEEADKIKSLEKNPMIAFEKEFLRWMLSDGAAAVLISGKPNENELSLKIEFIEICSYANEVETCMYAGGEKLPDGEIKGWAAIEQKDWLEKSIFSMRQDVHLLDKNIARLGTIAYIGLLKKYSIDPKNIDWLLPHISSEYFRSKVDNEMKKYGVELPQDKWFINLGKVGNIGSASIFIALEELIESGKLKKGQKIFLTVPESARFSFANALLTVC